MATRQKKPPVKPEKRQEWLDRSESGESAPKIAAADGYDARTVRKYLAIAAQERETKEARSAVLRNALERHYADLCRYAESLGESSRRAIFPSLDSPASEAPVVYPEQLGIALRQHIPKSPIWNYLSQRTKLETSKAELTKELGMEIEQSIKSDSLLRTELTDEESGVMPGIIDALKAQSQFWVQDYATLNPEENLISKPSENGFVELRYGAYQMGKVREDHVELIRAALTNWTGTIKEWPDFLTLKRVSSDLQRVEGRLRDEIAVIALRRVVPGRCRYCPL